MLTVTGVLAIEWQLRRQLRRAGLFLIYPTKAELPLP
jgi:hypothetical protein